MTIGVILAIGESFNDFKAKGQAKRMIDYNIKAYSKNFEKVYIFSYDSEKWDLPKNCHLIANKHKLPRIIYALFMPLVNLKEFGECDVLRCFQVTGSIPAIFTKLFLNKSFLFNYGYDYQNVAKMEGKIIRAAIMSPLTFIASILADAIIVTNRKLTAKLPQSSLNKVRHIPNGVDTKIFKPKVRKPSIITKALYIGRLEKEKNLGSLFEALSKVKDISLTVIGQGSEKSYLQGMAGKLKLSVKFIPKVEYYLLPKYYQQSDVFVLPSFTEGHSKVLLEAQSSGLICLASDIEANRQIVKNNVNGILTKTDAKSLQVSLSQIVKNKNKKNNLGINARINVEKNYEVRRLVEKEIALIRTLAK